MERSPQGSKIPKSSIIEPTLPKVPKYKRKAEKENRYTDTANYYTGIKG